jgi:hypothetical protein
MKKRKAEQYDAVLLLESHFVRELFAYIRNFQDTISVGLSAKGLEVCNMDSAHISVIRLLIRAEGCLYYEWNTDRNNFVVGLQVESWKRALQSTAEKGMVARLSFSADKDESRFETGVWDLKRRTLCVVNDVRVKNLDIGADSLTMPTDPPWISFTLDSAVLRREITKRAQMKPDDIVFRFKGKEVSVPSDEVTEADFLGEAPTTMTTRFVPDELQLSTRSGLVDWTTKFKLVESATVASAAPAWRSGARIKSDIGEEEEDENGEKRKATPQAVIDGLDEEESLGVDMNLDIDRRMLRQCGIVKRVGPIEPLNAAGQRRTEFYYSPKILNNVSAGASFASRVTVEIDHRQMIHMVYDMEKLGKIESYIAARDIEQ